MTRRPMTKAAKGRGDTAPPDLLDLGRSLEAFRAHYERTGNPLFVWKALIFVDYFKKVFRESEEGKAIASQLPFPPAVAVPDWCWRYLSNKALIIEHLSRVNRPWEVTKGEFFEDYEPLAKNGDAGAKRFLEAVEKVDVPLTLKASTIVELLPQSFGFVDGAHSNAFLDYWRLERKADVARAWDEAQREGKTPKEILEAVSVKFGIYDEPTIRRIVKEASGKKLPRRRSNKPKAPKGKKG